MSTTPTEATAVRNVLVSTISPEVSPRPIQTLFSAFGLMCIGLLAEGF